MLGDPVNTASRLCSKAAPGEILLSPALYEKLADKPQVDQLEPLALKGKAKPVPVLRIKG